jgi:hypothetical protein
MDRGIPTEEVLTEMRASVPPIYYLVGTPKGRLTKLEADLLERPWQRVRPGVEVKVLPLENELYVFAQSHARVHKERAMRLRQLKALWKRLGQLQQMKFKARELLLRLGEAKARYRAAWRLIEFQLPEPTTEEIASFGFALNRQKLRQIRRREGRYLLRTNLCGRDPAQLWQFYIADPEKLPGKKIERNQYGAGLATRTGSRVLAVSFHDPTLACLEHAAKRHVAQIGEEISVR